MNNKILVSLVVVAVLLVGGFYAYSALTKKGGIQTEENRPLQTVENEQVLPTKTAQELKVIAAVEDHIIEIKDNKFNPETVTIKPNDQVIWENKDNTNHNVTGEGWGGVAIGNGERFAQAFTKKGTYDYSCSIHPDMKGKVVVE